MADIIDQEAKRRGISRDALVAYYMKQRQMTGANGTGGVAGQQDPFAAPAHAAPAPQPAQDNRGFIQRILDGLSGRT